MSEGWGWLARPTDAGTEQHDDPAAALHQVGTFAQVHSITQTDSGPAQVLLYGHRRLQRLGTVETDPLRVEVKHLRDHKYGAGDDTLKVRAPMAASGAGMAVVSAVILEAGAAGGRVVWGFPRPEVQALPLGEADGDAWRRRRCRPCRRAPWRS